MNLSPGDGGAPAEVRAELNGACKAVLEYHWEDDLLKVKKRGEGVCLDDGGGKGLANAETILRHEPRWKGRLVFDEFRQQVFFREPPPWLPPDAPQAPWDDHDDGRLVAWFARSRFSLSLDGSRVTKAAFMVASTNRYNPVIEWFDGLVWDGKPRLDRWLSLYLGVVDAPFARFAGRKWLISSVARAYKPGCQADYVLILEGDQDIGKSSALRKLFGDYFSETPLDLNPNNKDRFLNLRGVLCQSFDELASMVKGEINTVKNFLTSPFDTYRPPYGKNSIKVNRQCVFAGTVNPQEGVGYLRDPTGNRRFWPVKCGVASAIDKVALERDRDQLWAEAVAAYKAGERWWPESPVQQALCRDEQEKREATNAWEEHVGVWLEGNPIDCQACRGSGEKGPALCHACKGTGKRPGRQRDPEYPFVTQGDVLEALSIPKERQGVDAHASAVARILVKLGWRPAPDGKRPWRRGVRVTAYYEPRADEPLDVAEREGIQSEPSVLF